jgi:hypothetical protein
VDGYPIGLTARQPSSGIWFAMSDEDQLFLRAMDVPHAAGIFPDFEALKDFALECCAQSLDGF